MIDASPRTAWAGKADMEMIVMPIPRADLAQPPPVALGVLAHLHFGARKDENAGCALVAGRSFYDFVMCAAPVAVCECALGAAQRNGRNVFALIARQVEPRCGQHPDVDIKAQLVAAVP